MDFRRDKLVNRSVALLFIYALWGFLFSHSVISNPVFVYASFLGLGLLFCLIFAKYPQQFNRVAIWIPYMFLTIIGYLLVGKIEIAIYWFVAIIILSTSQSIDYSKYLPMKILKISGIICVIGTLLQVFLPQLYFFIASHVFSYDAMVLIMRWNYGGMGYSGFTYQLAMTAIILLYAECVWLYMYSSNLKRKLQKNLHWIIIGLIVVCIFLTGKRMLSMISILAPTLVGYLTSIKRSKTTLIAFFAIIVGIIGYTYIESNASQLSDSALFGRFARSIEAKRGGEDITSGREDLFKKAITLFESSPIVGVGCGKFIEKSGEDSDVHNSFLQILCEQGLVGFVLFLIPLIVTLFKTISFSQKIAYTKDVLYSKMSLFLQIAFIIYAFTGNVTVNLFGFIVYFYAVAMFVSLRKKYSL